jgi:RNA polymerase sigma factor (sigma-70 family)
MTTDETRILAQLKNRNEKEFLKLYNSYKQEFVSFLQGKFSMSRDEAFEIFQQAMVTFYENVINNKLNELTSSLKTYVFAIGKNKALEALRRRNKIVPLEFNTGDEDDIKFELFDETGDDDTESRYASMSSSLEQLGKPCSDIVVLFYFQKLSLVEIKDRFNYKSEESIKSQKFKCMERLRKIYFQLYRKGA